MRAQLKQALERLTEATEQLRVTQARIEELEKLKTPPRNGALLDPLEAVIQYTSTMTWKGKHPLVTLVTTYQTGVKLTKRAMQAVETQRSSIPTPGQVVRGYCLSLTSCPG
jgi:hypothetical protein